MTCAQCQTNNRPERRFCSDCGVSLASHCARCGFLNFLDEKYCGGCGDDSGATPLKRTDVHVRVAEPSSHSDDLIGDAELVSLMQGTSPTGPASLPAHVSQEELDRLFGAGS